MKRLITNSFSIALILLSAAAAAAVPTMGVSAGRDLDALWQQAQSKHDLQTEDAVVLLESRQVAVQDNGDVATRVHRVVWIGTSPGIRNYADLRVPWNSATSSLDVEILRTWRDDRWWPDATRLSDSAIVHTLPYAVRNAYDYGALRETMLLHDGVELPCIMETAYTITERGLPGADGVFVLAQRDPAVLVELTVQAPTSLKVQYLSLNGAPAAENSGQGWSWRMSDVPALGLPHAAVATASEPTAAWSTWQDHDEMVKAWRAAFDHAAATVDLGVMGATLQEYLQPAAGEAARVRAVVDFVAATVATTHCDDGFWRYAPRPAARVWESGCGHPLDLTVLTAGILRELDFNVVPVFVGPRSNEQLLAAPLATGLGDPRLAVTWSGPSPGLILDPGQGKVRAESSLADQVLAPMAVPFALHVDQPRAGELDVTLVLEAGDDGTWHGSGEIAATGQLSFAGHSGSGRTALADRIAAVVSSALPGATSSDCGIQSLTPTGLLAEFAVALTAGDADDTTWRWTLSAPSGGILAALADEVHLTDATRETPVQLPAPLVQTVTAKVHLADLQAVHLPAKRELKNAAGSFTVTAEIEDGWLYYTRELKLNAGQHSGAAWPQLRALLLEEDDAANGTIEVGLADAG